jgi:ABC-type phosphate transport system substrate-binding protein
MKKTYKVCAVAAVSGAVLATAGPARAASVDCSSATAVPNPVYIAGSSASKPILIALAKVLASQTPAISILYSGPSSCVGLEDVVAGTTESTAWSYLDPVTGAADTCVAGANAYPAEYVDIGASDVFPSSCIQPQITLTSSFQEFHGAIQPMEITVPWSSSENSISYDAAYTVFGWAGAMYPVMPWTVPTAVWTRGDTSGTQLMVANAIGLAGNKWLTGLSAEAGAAQVAGSSGAMVTDIEASGVTNANATIGVLSAGTLDPLKAAPGTNDAGAATGGLKPLAFQAKDESCGYYADSSLSTFDKINVRQGRYAIWGPLHFVTNVNGGTPIANPMGSSNLIPSTSANVAAVIALITHQGLAVNSTGLKTVIAAEASAHFVPDCAMEVSRSAEVTLATAGGEASYAPTGACGCYFESVTGGGTTTSSYCQTCTADADCADAGVYTHCNYGYCEAQ